MVQQPEVEYVTEENNVYKIALSGFIFNNCCDSLFWRETEDSDEEWNKKLKGLVSILSGRISQTNTQLNSHLKRSLALSLVRFDKELDTAGEGNSSWEIVILPFGLFGEIKKCLIQFPNQG